MNINRVANFLTKLRLFKGFFCWGGGGAGIVWSFFPNTVNKDNFFFVYTLSIILILQETLLNNELIYG